MTKRAVFWVAWGERYIREACISAESVARHMPGLSRILMIQGGASPAIFTEILHPPAKRVKQRVHEGLASLGLRVDAIHQLTHYDELLFLDSDTYVCAPVHDFFDMLKRFSIVGVHDGGRITRPTVTSIPDAFVEHNGGVLAFRNGPKVRALWDDALARYTEYPHIYKRGNQGAIREAMWLDKRGLQIGTAPEEYCFRFPFGGRAMAGMVKILHGRPKEHSFEKICRILSAEGGVWGPGELATPHSKFRRVKVERHGKAGL